MPATDKMDKRKDPQSSTPDKKTKTYTTYRVEETTEIPIIHGIPGDYVEVSLPPPNSIAEVLEPITRVIYREKKLRDYNSNGKVRNISEILTLEGVAVLDKNKQ